GVMLDHLQLMQSDPIHLPLPRDGRARRIVSQLQQEPSDQRPLDELAKTAGGSKRTIERLFKSETGLGFGKWRQQFRLGHALRLLAAGQAVTSVALDVGYDSPSAFISAFRVTFGQTPGEYFRAASLRDGPGAEARRPANGQVTNAGRGEPKLVGGLFIDAAEKRP